MLITKHFVFIHFQKTGGCSSGGCAVSICPRTGSWRAAAHARGPRPDPGRYAHLPAIAFIRNPWDWYVSWYHWETQYLGSGSARSRRATAPVGDAAGPRRHDLRRAVTDACTRREGERPWEVAMRAWDVDLLTAAYAIKTGRYPGDLATELADRVPADGRAVEVGRFEHLRDDFLSFLERHDVPAPAEFVEAVRASPPRHGSRRGAYDGYYDDELRELVAHSARHVIAEHGYE